MLGSGSCKPVGPLFAATSGVSLLGDQEGLIMTPSGSHVVVNAKPEAVALDTSQTAVIVVDMQNDFGSEGGMFALAGIDISGIRNTIAPTARVLSAVRRAGLPVIYLKMAFHSDLSNVGGSDAPNWIKHRPLRPGDVTTAPDGTASRILVRDTWNTEIVPELAPELGDTLIYKHRFSGFYETELDQVLRSRSIKSLIFTGCTTSVCVESTIRDAMFRDYTCLLLEDCTAEPIGDGLPRSNHDASLLVIQALFGWVSDSAGLISAFEEQVEQIPA
jgi:ureidoacrylate peracid hydrolase